MALPRDVAEEHLEKVRKNPRELDRWLKALEQDEHTRRAFFEGIEFGHLDTLIRTFGQDPRNIEKVAKILEEALRLNPRLASQIPLDHPFASELLPLAVRNAPHEVARDVERATQVLKILLESGSLEDFSKYADTFAQKFGSIKLMDFLLGLEKSQFISAMEAFMHTDHPLIPSLGKKTLEEVEKRFGEEGIRAFLSAIYSHRDGPSVIENLPERYKKILEEERKRFWSGFGSVLRGTSRFL